MPAIITFTVTIESSNQEDAEAAYEALIDAAIDISNSENASVTVFAPEDADSRDMEASS